MNMAGRSMVTIDDLSNGEIEGLFSLANEMSDSMGQQATLCQGKIMASLFFEPSTRTRLSFETAMNRLGGRVISAVDIGATSLAKGESVADMARVAGSYADVIVIRHPWEGAAGVVAEYAGVPVINAGDGGHEHPTQTLCDLYTVQKERQTIKGLRIALSGDLKYGRTIHSLSYALARFGATILFHPYPGLEMPEYVLRKLTTRYKGKLRRYEALGTVSKKGLFPIDAVYVTPSSPHQLAMIPDVSMQVELEKDVDALYVTRIQKERQIKTEGKEAKNGHVVVDKELLKKKKFKETLVMHPLPRVDELAYEVDGDPRSMYFKQAARGVPVRMALLALLLGAREITVPDVDDYSSVRQEDYPVYRRDSGLKCSNPKCITNQESEIGYIKSAFKIVSLKPLTLNCFFCEHELYPKYIASADWHEGKTETKKYHSATSSWIRRIHSEKLIIFDSEEEAQSRGFKPSSYVTGYAEPENTGI